MNTPIHVINIDFTHSSEAKLLHSVIENHMNPCNDVDEDNYLSGILVELEEAIELMESLEA
ncbi:TPA: hypothetical protein N2902_004628 [Vibrio parahaemolyticus]|uniref:hypothetical protein n=1 Tax=Vibrio parahaemolyticus TaxID=670 RepID=UPI0011201827|nr:hypothetical protein [Vibrio parahaemolyticus]TOL88874.1 hypothetical protein CGH88_22765 [Vibrio parahaemolyticus]HCG9714469.1 hypothetical protein [Vibrio parahaemolyticus]HCH1153041.1 hypothetical protein [Vibrio parahaemolyticus]HCM1332994.1 hypothetical protein [Vibrio parahaemolyticus]